MIHGVVLAGGEARRMGGNNKGLMCHAATGQPMSISVAETLNRLCDKVWINANTDFTHYDVYGYQVIPDVLDYKGVGPLAGIYSALKQLTDDAQVTHVLFCPCDTPFITCSELSVLITAMANRLDLIAYLATPAGAQPLHAIWPVTVRPALESYLNRGGRKVTDFYQLIGAQMYLSLNEANFQNCNYITDLR